MTWWLEGEGELGGEVEIEMVREEK